MDTPATGENNRHDERETQRAKAPYVAVSLRTTGIHPSTARIVGVDLAAFSEDGEVVETFQCVLNPGPNHNPGPVHYHGLTREEITQGKRFSSILKQLDRFIDGRTLIVHDTPKVWGFIVSEARRAMNAAARANRSRNRNRGGRNRRRRRVGHVPKPERIIDTLATARRGDLTFHDIRPLAVAAAMGLDAPDYRASVQRADRDEAELMSEETSLLIDMYQWGLENDHLAETTPDALRADRFGLQRSQVRVDAFEAPQPKENPGQYQPGHSLAPGMEVVVAPEIEMDPDEIIAALMRAGLVYNEKLTRQTSVVVSNRTRDLRGKAMHAARKGIPLLSDVAFMEAVARVKDSGDTH